ncbi:MAG: putative F0F1-ATPase subunit Ca2+/Mg2+ transporter [Frankiales bacterium]|jgi:F0F1-type ATP synthase assembly protein I|nr:putative F0F1-ATPase subunit Ca2+/Mg2+ transporter [Frankiales bacterium]
MATRGPRSGGPSLVDLLTLGVSAGASVGLGFGIGWLLDSQLDTVPVCTMIGLAAGVVLAVATVWAQMRKFLRQ